MQSNERKQFLSLFSHLSIDWMQNHQVKNTGNKLSPRGTDMHPCNTVVLLNWLTKLSKQTHWVKFCSASEVRAEQKKQTWTWAYRVKKIWVRRKETEEGKRVLFGFKQWAPIEAHVLFQWVIITGMSVSIDSVSRAQLHFAILPLRISIGSENICVSHELPPEKIRMDKPHLQSGRKWNPDKSSD